MPGLSWQRCHVYGLLRLKRKYSVGRKHLVRFWPRWASLRVAEITVAMGLALVIGLGVGIAAIAVDATWLWPPPIILGNVDSARVLLGSLTAGVITVAVFGLWMRTVVVGLMAAHFSPRTLLTFLDDRFQLNLLAFMSAGAVAVMVILLRLPVDGEAAAPLVSTVLAVLIALAALAGVILAIQQGTRSLSLPELISRLAEDALDVLDRLPESRIELFEVPPPVFEPRTVMATRTGWVTGIDIDRMRKALPVGGVVHLRCRIGEFVTPRRTVALVSSVEVDAEVNLDDVAAAVQLSRTRSPEMDLAFAVSQLVDVGTFALQSRADTSTAHEVMVHLENVLEEVVDRGLPRMNDRDDDGRCVYDEVGWDSADLVQLCVERLRDSTTQDPEASRHLILLLHRVQLVAEKRDATEVVAEVEYQVKAVLALVDHNGMMSRDRQRLEREVKGSAPGG